MPTPTETPELNYADITNTTIENLRSEGVPTTEAELEAKDDIQPGDNVIVHGSYELRCDMFLLPTQQGPVGIQKTTVVPVDAEEDGVDILVKVDNIRWFEDMPDRGRENYC